MSKKNKYGFSSADFEKLYNVWKHIKDRCYKPCDREYHAYGGRGVKMCNEWLNDFHVFSDWAVENGWEPGITIERIDNDGDYCPDNCRFVTWREQMYNKQNTVYIEIDGETKSLPEWCDIFGVGRGTVGNRIFRGETDPARIFFKGNMRDFGRRIVQKATDGSHIQTYKTARDAADAAGISLSSIHNCCRGLCKTSGGYVWEYQFIKEN